MQVKGFIGNKSALIVKAINLNICIYIFELTINQKAVQSPKQILFKCLMFNLEIGYLLCFIFYLQKEYTFMFVFHLSLKNEFLTDGFDGWLNDRLLPHLHFFGEFLAMLGLIEARNIEPFLLPCRLRIACASESAGHALPSSSSSLPSPIFSAHLNLFTPLPQIPRTHSFQFSSCLFKHLNTELFE